jgi:putative addiction module antidote
MRLKIIKIGNTLGVALSEELLENLKISEGDDLFAQQTDEGIALKPYQTELMQQLSVVENVMDRNKYVLKKLADS